MKEYNQNNYIGSKKQLNGVELIKFLQGTATGMKAYRVYTQAGLSMIVSLDRGMDIPELKIFGKNISFMSSTGLVNSTYFVENGTSGFMKNFTVGFLTTGGLSYMGSPSSEGKGLHGVISNTPAENFSYEDEGDFIVIQGDVRETAMFGPNLKLRRKLKISKFTNTIYIKDVISNEGNVRTPIMLLYHSNFGYPFFSAETKLKMKTQKSFYRDGETASAWDNFRKPEQNREEVVYSHFLETDSNGLSYVFLKSPLTKLQVRITIDTKTLPILNQWKLEQTSNYVLGIEPATNNVNGFDQAKRDRTLKYLKPHETKEFNLKYEFTQLEG